MTPALRRLLAIAVALVLALIGAVSVVSYANRADERAIGEQQPTAVLIITQEIPRGTPGEGLAASVRSTLVPASAVARGAVTDLGDIKFALSLGLVLGWLGAPHVLLAVLATFTSSAVVGALLAARRVDLADRVPFGPHLALGTTVVLIGGDPAAAWLTGVLTR
jgi:prepilin signal peptidase PulO-like enzyme (type II secretory pathway)